MKRSSVGFKKSTISIKNAVDLLYTNPNNYKVPTKKENNLIPKQELVSTFSLPRADSDQQYQQLELNPKKECSIRIIQKRSQDDRGENHSDSDESQPSPNKEFKKIQFFTPKAQSSSGFTLVESQFGKNVKKLSSIVNEATVGLGYFQKNVLTTIDAPKDKSIDMGASVASSYVGKQEKETTLRYKKSNLAEMFGKSNFSEKSKTIQFGESTHQHKVSPLKGDDQDDTKEPISKVQEVILNIQNEGNFSGESKRRNRKKKKILLDLDNAQKKKNKLQLSSKVSLENKSSSSLNVDEEGSAMSNDGISNLKKQKSKKLQFHQHLQLQDQEQQQALNLEGFRLHRSFSDEENLQNMQNEQHNLQTKNAIDNPYWSLSKKATMVDLFDKSYQNKNSNKQFNNLYLDHFNRLGMEEWKTTKLKMGEYLWNAKIDQLKASIKKKMPAYSTNLLKQWEDYDFEPTQYASKRNISQHKDYFSPTKFKTSFKFYSPSSELANPSKRNVTSQSIYTQAIKIDSSSNINNKSVHAKVGSLENTNSNKNVMKKIFKAVSPYTTIQSNTSSNGRNLLSTAQTENKPHNNSILKNIKHETHRQEELNKLILQQKFSEKKNYQQEYQDTQKKLISRQIELKKIVSQIKDHQNSVKDKPIIPLELIQIAKKQSQTSFFQLQDLGKQKKTFRFFEQTPQYSTQEEVDDQQTLKKMKQRSNTYKIFRNHVRQYLSSQKD